MAQDPFEDLLELENEFYREGYDAGVADSTYAGMIEGKVFGIEKGYEKALDLAKRHGRALVWQSRLPSVPNNAETQSTSDTAKAEEKSIISTKIPSRQMKVELDVLPAGSRLQKNIESLVNLTDGGNLSPNNTDEAVMDYDDRLAKAKAKAKVISNVIGEQLDPVVSSNAGIEDATGLKARH